MPKYQVTVYAVANVVTEIDEEADTPEEAEALALKDAKSGQLGWEYVSGEADFEVSEDGPVEVDETKDAEHYDFPDVYEWPQDLLDEILADHGLHVEELYDADNAVDMLVDGFGFSRSDLMDRIEADRLRTEKRCSD